MTRSQVEAILKSFSGVKVLVIGDLILDKYIWGKTQRISPEAPVQVVEVEREEIRLGGAGNVACNLQILGCQVAVASVVGADEDGQKLLSLMMRQGLEVAGVNQSPQRITSRKSRVLASRQQMLRIDRELTQPISQTDETDLLRHIEAELPTVKAVVVSDYLKGVLTPSLLEAIIEGCRQLEIPVVVDPKGEDFSRYQGATVLTPNRHEAEIASKVTISDQAGIIAAGERLLHDLELEGLILTRSEEGMSIFSADGSIQHQPTEAQEVFDVSGAGDTVVALVGAALAVGLSLSESARIANLAAGIAVSKLGTSTVAPIEILDELARRRYQAGSKILTQTELGNVLEPLQQAGKIIVFTNGCFDLLHAGHVKYLQQARALGDMLVLGLNSDASIRRLKGKKRPLLDETERAKILAALDCIDFLTIFSEDTPLELLEIVRPQILVKGGDYSPSEVVGKDLVESYGGRVELIQFVDGKSTTNIIDKVLSRYRDE